MRSFAKTCTRERKRAQGSAKERKCKSAKGRKRTQKSAKELFRVKFANNQVWETTRFWNSQLLWGFIYFFPFAIFFLFQKNSRRLELSISKNTPHGRLGQGPGSVGPRFPAGLPFPMPEILEFVAFGNSGKFFQQFSREFPAIFLQNSRTDPRNSHSLLVFSDCCFLFSGVFPSCSKDLGAPLREESFQDLLVQVFGESLAISIFSCKEFLVFSPVFFQGCQGFVWEENQQLRKRGLWEGVVQEPLRRALFCVFLCSEVIFSCKSRSNFFQKLPLQCRHFLENPFARNPKTQLLRKVLVSLVAFLAFHRKSQEKKIKVVLMKVGWHSCFLSPETLLRFPTVSCHVPR